MRTIWQLSRISVLAAALAWTTPIATSTAPQAAAVRPAQRAAAAPAGDTRPPVGKDSVKFAVIGDTGTGDRNEYEVGAMLARSRQVFPFDFVIMMGDNMYGSERPQDFVNKF